MAQRGHGGNGVALPRCRQRASNRDGSDQPDIGQTEGEIRALTNNSAAAPRSSIYKQQSLDNALPAARVPRRDAFSSFLLLSTAFPRVFIIFAASAIPRNATHALVALVHVEWYLCCAPLRAAATMRLAVYRLDQLAQAKLR